MSVISDKTEGQLIYDKWINSMPVDFWTNYSEEGMRRIKECIKELSAIGTSQVFSGHPERGWTFTTVAERIDSLSRREDYWRKQLSE